MSISVPWTSHRLELCAHLTQNPSCRGGVMGRRRNGTPTEHRRNIDRTSMEHRRSIDRTSTEQQQNNGGAEKECKWDSCRASGRACVSNGRGPSRVGGTGGQGTDGPKPGRGQTHTFLGQNQGTGRSTLPSPIQNPNRTTPDHNLPAPHFGLWAYCTEIYLFAHEYLQQVCRDAASVHDMPLAIAFMFSCMPVMQGMLRRLLWVCGLALMVGLHDARTASIAIAYHRIDLTIVW